METTKKIGDTGELIAIKYLQKNGYIILDTNFKFSRFGEIDIICKKDDRTYFIEVKYRNNDKFGLPEEAITKAKLHKLKRTIDYYVVGHHLNFEKIQFDVIAITKEENAYKVKHYKNLAL